MRKKITTGFLCVALLSLYWINWETSKQVAALQNQSISIKSNLDQLIIANNNMGGALVEVIRRAGYTNMLQQK